MILNSDVKDNLKYEWQYDANQETPDRLSPLQTLGQNNWMYDIRGQLFRVWFVVFDGVGPDYRVDRICEVCDYHPECHEYRTPVSALYVDWAWNQRKDHGEY
ncbi:12100_t:CDS:2 [Ambispora leptoticha]|uniref:12100_t:CDS:1 n=1 Tax=Ambispora leptoticha TaxID=144679 RepID=A0A9N8YKX7_9GLOM|nr:12100_t:CDS:2 [Ambispora leptoticha]